MGSIGKKRQKHIVSLIVAVKNDIKFVDRFLHCILNQSDQRFEVIFVCEEEHDGTIDYLRSALLSMNKIDYKVVLRKNDFSYPVRIPRKLVKICFRTNIDYNQYVFKIKWLNWFFTKKEKNGIEYRYPNFEACFNMGDEHAKGEFVVFLSMNIFLANSFIEVIKREISLDDKLGILMIPLTQIGDYRTLVQSKQFNTPRKYEPIAGTKRNIEMNQLGQNVVAMKRQTDVEHTKRFNVFYRTLKEKSFDLGKGYGEIAVLEDYANKIKNKVLLSNRFLELKTYLWEVNTHHNIGVDIEKVQDVLNDGIQDLARIAKELSIFCALDGDSKLEAEYKNFRTMIDMISDSNGGWR